jgi:diguanylate cyclase (GGDEF)-like protein
MTQNAMHDIIELCHAIDVMAEEVYCHFSRIYSDKEQELSLFWEQMANEEREHILFWASLLPLAKKGMIPQIFDSPSRVKDELLNIKDSINRLEEQIFTRAPFNKGFLVAYRLEFYVLHPAFEVLYHFARGLEEIGDINIPGNSYGDHISRFIDGLNRFGRLTPEMELLGETLTRLWKENRTLAVQGSTDYLTNILNRRGFLQAINPLAYFAHRNKYHVGVLMIDIDHFKIINDTYGHQKGDTFLSAAARTIKSSVRKSDICGRYGGEEFIVFLSRVEPGMGKRAAEKIRRNIETLRPMDIPLTVSIGGTDGPIGSNVEKDLEGLIKISDLYLYEAKESGRNTVVYQMQS